jgi:small subunit ribosomal protein S3
MGHKVNPKVYRLGFTTSWTSKWFGFGNQSYAKKIEEDTRVKDFLYTKLKDAGIANVEIDRAPGGMTVTIHSSKPGIIIGRGGTEVEALKKSILAKILKDKKLKLSIEIKEIKEPQLSARIMAQNIVSELEKRVPYRKCMRRNIENIMKAGAKGGKIVCGGRLDGVEIARTETVYQGKVPLQTLRADIDYANLPARTTYGAIGVKVWIYKGDVFENRELKQDK